MKQSTCTLCSQSFTVEEADTQFLAKFDAPVPDQCWNCRSQQRIAHRNETSIYADQCDLCNKQMISQYSPDKNLTVYCKECWWSDKWDPYQYGREYDASRPFFEQFNDLLRQVPLINLLDMKSENSDYTNCTSNNKSCYLIFSSDFNQDSMYSNWIMRSKDVVDCFRVSNSEQAYQCFFGENLYNSQYLVNCRTARDSMFCYDSRNISNCVLSWNLRNAEYMILNRQYTKEEYEAKVAEMKLDTHEGRVEALEKFQEIVEQQAIHNFAVQQGRVDNVTGDYIRDLNNSAGCFDMDTGDNLRHVRNMDNVKDSMECEYGGDGENGFQNIETYPMPTHAMCTYGCYGGNDIFYSFYVMNSKDVFGSSGVKKAQYVILNKKYSQEEYEALRAQIKADMMQRGEWGSYFPAANSLFGYNETNAQDWYTLTKEQAEERGWPWHEVVPSAVQPELSSDDLPETIAEVSDDILKQSIGCAECSKAYRITAQELAFYRQLNIPLPDACYNCRYAERREWHNPMQLRQAQCTNESPEFGSTGRCPNMFETTYPEGKVNNIYCKECYTAELY